MFGQREAKAFVEGLERSAAVQAEVLAARILGPNAGTAFGRRHGFASIADPEDFRRAVPVQSYEGFRAEVDRMLEGEPDVLVAEAPKRFFLTSGSSARPKHVPVTPSFVRDKSRAFGIFWNLVWADHPGVARSRMVTNFSDAGGARPSACGVPISSESAFWAEVTAATQRKEPLIPRAVARLEDQETRYHVIGRILLAEDFGAIMALNPSTLLLLFQKLGRNLDRLIADVERGGIGPDVDVPDDVRALLGARYPAAPARAAELRALARSGPLSARRLFPGLELAVSWRSPMLRPYLDLLEPHLEGVAGRDYVTMASEGVMAIPLASGESGGALAVGVHFYELMPLSEVGASAPRTLWPHEAEVGQEYVLVLSTSAGLYRYDIGDVVRVKRRVGTTPVIEFLHRAGATCSLTGEKLTEAQVTAAMSRACGAANVRLSSFVVVPSMDGLPAYRVLVEAEGPAAPGALARLGAAFDRELAAENLEYASKRRSERLGAPALWVVAPGSFARLAAARVAAGAAEAQVKPVHLTRDPAHVDRFPIVERHHAADRQG